jgi:pimeloyl-ACP methyl ester carboxylesterase
VTVELGYDELGAGLPLVLLHAFPLTADMWAEQRAALAPYCRVITPDLRGFGRSPLGEDAPDVDHMADDVAALLDRLGLDTVVLGGLSMGGYVAMAMLRRHAGRVRGLLLASTKATADATPARDVRIRIAETVAKERGPRVLEELVLPNLLGETTKQDRPDIVARVREQVGAARPDGVAWAQRAMADRPESFGTLRAADLPALVVLGEEDALSPPADAQAMADALPRGRLVVIPAAGHLSAVEAPGQFAAAVRGLLADVGAP